MAVSVIGSPSILANDTIDLGEIRIGERDNLNHERLGNLTDKEKSQIVKEHILKNGELIQALDTQEIEKAFSKMGNNEKERIVFKDGSSITITSTNKNDGKSMITSTSSTTARADFLIESWTGLDLAEYTLYQDFKYDGTRVVSWYTPYTKYWVLPIISQWELVSENYGTARDGDIVLTTGGAKFRYGIWDIATIQTISISGKLELRKNGTYYGYFRVL